METLSHFRNSCKNNPSVVWRPFWGCCWGFPRTIPRWPTAVAANGLNQLYRRLSGRASNYSTLRTSTTTKLLYKTPTAAIQIQYLRCRINTEVVKDALKKSGDIGWCRTFWQSLSPSPPFNAWSDQIKRKSLERILGASKSARSNTALFLFGILWNGKHPRTHYTVLH